MGSQRTTGRVYGVSFVSASERKGIKYSQIVFKVPNKHIQETDRLLARCSIDSQSDAEDGIFMHFDSEFVSTKTHFGFGSCGTREETDDEMSYRINLMGHKLAGDIAMTIGVLCEILGMVFATSEIDGAHNTSNRHQLMTITADRYTRGYGVHGYVYPDLGGWLAEYGDYNSKIAAPFGREFFQGPALPASVHEAMRTAWEAVVPDDLTKYSGECYAGIKSTGCFLLSCFGDACDVAIYPDLATVANPGHPVKFGCHNVDSPWQVITLVAGLAVLHDLAARELG